ncbi:hypothetical protein C8C94_1492 [Acidovorax sp. 94]|uniref:hypothetical protein n=1 Tax=Acidovorax sp. 94 TaxID=2135633 RepID=UPI000EB2F24E|nr:hypothetical protein [Acidovorax sp. 94]RKR67019.1 hypothetical protein C8C94_1492 [Acidovorax sp. 94]
MKSRELFTTPVLIVTGYAIVPQPNGKFLHKFTPETTNTVYQFIANQEPVLEEGQRYNIGYTVDNGVNWVDISATAKADDVDQHKSHYVSRLLGEERRAVETQKSDDRVQHNATDGQYLGKKYAWRIYGMAVARDTFDAYLDDINHPRVPCRTEDSPSIAYKEAGLAAAMDALIQSAVWVAANRFRSPLLPSKKWFQIKGISAITDKK